MGLIVIWISFILFMGIFQELTQLDYFLYSSFMLCFMYLYNLVNYTNISPRIIVIVSSIPSIIFWYVAFVYNDFLSLTSIKYEMFITVLFVYLYMIIYIFCEYQMHLKQSLRQKGLNLNEKLLSCLKFDFTN